MSKDTRYGLLYSEYEFSPYLRIPFEKFVLVVVCFPLFAFVFCISYSVLFNFESVTYTHCDVYNMLPSISAAIGNFSPQREIWQGAIAIHALPRFYIAYEYLNHHNSVLYPHDLWIAQIAFSLNIIENMALILLSFFTSSQSYAVHEKAFITFIIGSEMYMILTCILQGRFKKQSRISLKWKKRLLIMNMFGIFATVYFFMRHNSFCEPYSNGSPEYFFSYRNIVKHFQSNTCIPECTNFFETFASDSYFNIFQQLALRYYFLSPITHKVHSDFEKYKSEACHV